jgi:hypothetical protein
VIVTDPDDLRDIYHGQEVEVRQQGELPDVGSVHPVQSRVGKTATCHVMVREAWAHVAGGYVAIVVKTVRVRQEAPNFLGKAGGYTPKGEHAIGTFDGDGPEPEAVPRDWVDPGAQLRVAQQAALDRATRERLSLGQELDLMLADADARSVDVHGRLRTIRREMGLLARDLGAEAA